MRRPLDLAAQIAAAGLLAGFAASASLLTVALYSHAPTGKLCGLYVLLGALFLAWACVSASIVAGPTQPVAVPCDGEGA